MQFCGISGLYFGIDWTRIGRVCTDLVRLNADDSPSSSRRGSSRRPFVAILIASVLALGGTSAAAETPNAEASPIAGSVAGSAQGRDTRGWIELEQDQRAYREAVKPLDLEQQRQLETIERSQALDLRALQQRNAREIERLERQQRIAPSSNLKRLRAPTRDTAADIRRRAERHRTNIRLQQEGLPSRR